MAVRIPCDLQRLSSAVRQDTVGDRRRNRPVSAPTHRPPYRPPSPKKHYHPPPSRHHPLPAASPLTPAPPRSHTPHRTPPRTAQDTSTSAINPSSPRPIVISFHSRKAASMGNCVLGGGVLGEGGGRAEAPEEEGAEDDGRAGGRAGVAGGEGLR